MTTSSDIEESWIGIVTEVINKVYRRPYAQEFRRPVYILHPNLGKEYLNCISSPIDLATILVKLHKGQYISVEACKNDLHLLFSNAIKFNDEALNMIAISKHLMLYTANIWEDSIGESFSDSMLGSIESIDQRESFRIEVYQFTFNDNLHIYEVNEIRARLHEIVKIPSLFLSIHENILSILNHVEVENSLSRLTLYDILFPMIEYAYKCPHEMLQDTSTLVTQSPIPLLLRLDLNMILSATANTSANILNVTPSFCALLPPIYDYLVTIDKAIGDTLYSLVERKCRGINLSAIWARPHRLVWAQPAKNPWWPGMVLAGAGVPKLLADTNWSRMPEVIATELAKIRPRAGGVHTDAVLVEFFGTHDFGWVKLDSVLPFERDGELPAAASGSAFKRGKDYHGSCSVSSIKEAKESLELLDAAEVMEDVPYPDVQELVREMEEVWNASQYSLSKGGGDAAGDREGGDATSSAKSSRRASKLRASNRKSDATDPMLDEIAGLPSSSASPAAPPCKLWAIIGADSLPQNLSKKRRAEMRSAYLSRWMAESKPIFVSASAGMVLSDNGTMVDSNEFIGDENEDDADSDVLRRGTKAAKFQSKQLQQQQAITKPKLDAKPSLKTDDVSDNNKNKKPTLRPNSPALANINSSVANINNAQGSAPTLTEESSKDLTNIPPAARALKPPAQAIPAVAQQAVVRTLEPTPLSSGCTSFAAGEGVVHSRYVDYSSPLFHLESRKRESRKAVLRAQLASLQREMARLQAASGRRVMDRVGAEQTTAAASSTKAARTPAGNIATQAAKPMAGPRVSSPAFFHSQPLMMPPPKKPTIIPGLPGKVGLIAQLEQSRQQQQRMIPKLAVGKKKKKSKAGSLQRRTTLPASSSLTAQNDGGEGSDAGDDNLNEFPEDDSASV